MTPRRLRPIAWAVGALLAGWLVAGIGFAVARRMEVTPARVARFLQETDLQALDPARRRAALDRLARMLNRLSLEDRRTARMEPGWDRWLGAMTDEEKLGLLDATLPSGVGQMLARFEELPEEQRLRTLSDAFRRLREARDEAREEAREDGEAGTAEDTPTNSPPVLTAELQRRAIQTGLNTFYSESSAQTKAELAPLLEELQRGMQSGRPFRPRRNP